MYLKAHILLDEHNEQQGILSAYIHDDIYESSTSLVDAKFYVKNRKEHPQLWEIEKIARQSQMLMATFKLKIHMAEM